VNVSSCTQLLRLWKRTLNDTSVPTVIRASKTRNAPIARMTRFRSRTTTFGALSTSPLSRPKRTMDPKSRACSSRKRAIAPPSRPKAFTTGCAPTFSSTTLTRRACPSFTS